MYKRIEEVLVILNIQCKLRIDDVRIDVEWMIELGGALD